MKTTEIKNILLKAVDKTYDITKRQTLIGSSTNCDIVIDHPTVSHYHAMLITDGHGGLSIIDLKSKNGTFVSAQQVQSEQFISFGDYMMFGDYGLHIHESTSEVAILDQDMALQEAQVEKINIPVSYNENLVLIDDEYCDISFEESEYQISDTNFFKNNLIDENLYETVDLEEDVLDIERKDKEEKCLQVTTTINGIILEQSYFSLSQSKIYASTSKKRNTILVDLIENKKELLLEIEGSTVQAKDLENFNLSSQRLDISEESPLIYTQGNFQILVEFVDAAAHLTDIPFLYRQKDFFKQTTAIFASLFIPFLALLLVNLNADKPKDEKKLAIIYKKPTKTKVDKKEHSSQNVTSTKENTGHKQKTKNPEKIANSKSGAKTKTKQKPKKTKKIAKKKPTKTNKKLAKASKVKKTKVAKAKAPVKSYSFKLAANTKSLFQKSVKNVSANTSATASSVSATSANVSSGKISGTSSAAVGNLGSDISGAANSFGSKGLSSRKGRDSSYIQTKTVVLGAMDPELLRKILRRYMPQFRHCYQQELTYNSEDIKGVVDLKFKISGKGKVKAIKIAAKDKRFSKRGKNCMKKVLSIIDFPAPKGGGTVAVRQPLNFFSDKS